MKPNDEFSPHLRRARSPARLTAIGVTATLVLALIVVGTLLLTGGGKAVSDNAALIGALVALGGVFTTQMVNSAFEDRRARDAREFEDRRAQEARDLEAQRANEATLQKYFEQAGKLLIEKSLREASPGDDLSTVARAQTLTALEGLDPARKRILLQFLYESGLISKDKPVVSLMGANLSDADLRDANLRDANLSGANLYGAELNDADLSEADLSEADLRYAHFSRANLRGANLREVNPGGINPSKVHPGGLSHYTFLRGADLRDADLSGATLKHANLSEANLEGADLWNVDLSDANLRGANMKGIAGITDAELEQIAEEQKAEGRMFAPSALEGTIMPNGWTHS